MVKLAGGDDLPIRSKTLGEQAGVPKFTEKGVVPPGAAPPAAGIDLSLVLESLAKINDTLQSMIQAQTSLKDYEHIFDTGLVAVTASTPTRPANSEIISVAGSPGYDRIQVYESLDRNSPRLSVINDGAETLFILESSDGENWSSVELPILTGEARAFYNVYELRIRSPTAGSLTTFIGGLHVGGVYRATEHEYWLPYSKIIAIGGSITIALAPASLSSLQNAALPAPGTNWLAADLVPVNTPTTFRIMVAVSVGGTFSAVITNGGNTQVLAFNAVAGPALVAGSLYTFEMLVGAGDTVNFRYSAGAGTIQKLIVQEVDAAVA